MTHDSIQERRSHKRNPWLWRVVTLAWSALNLAVRLKWWRASQEPSVLQRDAGALRRACLGFPLPVLLQGRSVRRFTSPSTGVQTLSYRVPTEIAPEAIHAYYEAYFREQGFAPVHERNTNTTPHTTEGLKGNNTRHSTVVYRHADGLRSATVSVVAPLAAAGSHTVVVAVKPLCAPQRESRRCSESHA